MLGPNYTLSLKGVIGKILIEYNNSRVSREKGKSFRESFSFLRISSTHEKCENFAKNLYREKTTEEK